MHICKHSGIFLPNKIKFYLFSTLYSIYACIRWYLNGLYRLAFRLGKKCPPLYISRTMRPFLRRIPCLLSPFFLPFRRIGSRFSSSITSKLYLDILRVLCSRHPLCPVLATSGASSPYLHSLSSSGFRYSAIPVFRFLRPTGLTRGALSPRLHPRAYIPAPTSTGLVLADVPARVTPVSQQRFSRPKADVKPIQKRVISAL